MTAPTLTARQVWVQLADPDHRPIPCSSRGCGRDAVFVARLRVNTADENALTACRPHTVTMIEAATRAAGEDPT